MFERVGRLVLVDCFVLKMNGSLESEQIPPVLVYLSTHLWYNDSIMANCKP